MRALTGDLGRDVAYLTSAPDDPRLTDDDPRLHACALAYLSDGNAMDAIAGRHPVTPRSPEEWAETFVSASLDHAVWFHEPVRADDWGLFDRRSPQVGGSRGVARGEVFQHGKLVATVAQEGLLRLRTR